MYWSYKHEGARSLKILRERGWTFHTEGSGWMRQDLKLLTGHRDHLKQKSKNFLLSLALLQGRAWRCEKISHNWDRTGRGGKAKIHRGNQRISFQCLLNFAIRFSLLITKAIMFSVPGEDHPHDLLEASQLLLKYVLLFLGLFLGWLRAKFKRQNCRLRNDRVGRIQSAFGINLG